MVAESASDLPEDSSAERRRLDYLFSITYEELRRLAARVRGGDPCVTLNTTALVNEAWLKLAGSAGFESTSLLHFKRIAARAMRQLLVEAARRRTAGKRGAGARLVALEDAGPIASGASEMLALDTALEELARLSPRQAQLVEARFFGGLEVAETALLLEISEATALRDWRAARAWLARQLREHTGDGPSPA
ncbi:MAG TPA: ECF-type sigma factor [Bryobacteraceae bacterium]|jgi:RNA polymerase sigma factor (TIGR02999 family)|nr:ECF-type sigma factor [Bryobacteraceae bacterium]